MLTLHRLVVKALAAVNIQHPSSVPSFPDEVREVPPQSLTSPTLVLKMTILPGVRSTADFLNKTIKMRMISNHQTCSNKCKEK